jgi:hypothetical protein
LFYLNGSDNPPEFYGATRIIFNKSQISAKRLSQIFRDGDTYHCVFDNIISYYEERLSCNLHKTTSRMYAKYISKATAYKEVYPNGVPEDKMEAIAEDLGVQIIYEDLFAPYSLTFKTQTHTVVFNKKQSHRVLKFYNNRQNHLELMKEPILREVDFETLKEHSQRPDVIARITRDGNPTNVYSPEAHYHIRIGEHQTLINKQTETIRHCGLSNFSPYADFVRSINLIHSIPVVCSV